MLPPVQQVEPVNRAVKIQSLPAARQLPGQGTLYYALREIPPRNNKPGCAADSAADAHQMFYRPAALAKKNAPWQEQLTLTRQGDKYVVN